MRDRNLYNNTRARRKRRRARRLTVVMIVLICIVAFIFGTLYYLANKFLTVKNVIVCGSSIYSKEQILKIADINIAGNDDMIFLLTGKIEDNIETKLPYVEEATIYRKFPDTIIIEVAPSEPYASMKTDTGNWLINENEKVLENLDEQQNKYNYLLVEFISDKKQSVGKKFIFKDSSQSSLYEKMVNTSKEYNIFDKLNNMDATDKYDLYMLYDNRIKISCGNYSDIEEKIRFAASIIAKRSETDKGIVYVENTKMASFTLTRS